MDEPKDAEEEEVVTHGDQCLCSNVNATAGITSVSQPASMTTTQAASSGKGQSKDKRSNKNCWGYGYCGCDGGLKSLRFVYKAPSRRGDVLV